MTRTTERATEQNGNREIINIGATIIHNTQRMHHLNLFVFVEAIFEPLLTEKGAKYWKEVDTNILNFLLELDFTYCSMGFGEIRFLK